MNRCRIEAWAASQALRHTGEISHGHDRIDASRINNKIVSSRPSAFLFLSRRDHDGKSAFPIGARIERRRLSSAKFSSQGESPFYRDYFAANTNSPAGRVGLLSTL